MHGWARRHRLGASATWSPTTACCPLYAACPDGRGVSVVAGTGADHVGAGGATAASRAPRAGATCWATRAAATTLGSEALRHIMRAEDGRGPKTALTARVLDALAVAPTPRQLVLHVYGRVSSLPSEIAGPGRACRWIAPRTGDGVALAIARAGADELALASAAAMRGGRVSAPPVALAYTGSLLVKSALYRALFAEADARAASARSNCAPSSCRFMGARRLPPGCSSPAYWRRRATSGTSSAAAESTEC